MMFPVPLLLCSLHVDIALVLHALLLVARFAEHVMSPSQLWLQLIPPAMSTRYPQQHATCLVVQALLMFAPPVGHTLQQFASVYA